jgi:Tfp pilus assembly ATPase PilU
MRASLTAALLELYQKGEITYETAMSAARNADVIRHRAG